jgi:chromosome segregation ATPase
MLGFLTLSTSLSLDATLIDALCFKCRVILLPVASSKLEYEALEAQERQLQARKDALGDCYAELKKELQEVKQTLDTVVAKLWKLKAQPA